ncbi:MAG: hypothetical protein R2713_13650 [Ilumatobacteraceae bacterium]
MSDLDGPNRYELEEKLLEVWLIESVEGEPLVFESYFRYSRVSSLGRQFWGQFAPVAIPALVALQLVQLPFAPMAWLAGSLGEDEARSSPDAPLDGSVRRPNAAASRRRSPRRGGAGPHGRVARTGGSGAPVRPTSSGKPGVGGDPVERQVASLAAGGDLPATACARRPRIRRGRPAQRDRPAASRPSSAHDEVDDHDLSADAQALAYRVVQEALRNVVSHSEQAPCW